jgi:hypothetical protein
MASMANEKPQTNDQQDYLNKDSYNMTLDQIKIYRLNNLHFSTEFSKAAYINRAMSKFHDLRHQHGLLSATKYFIKKSISKIAAFIFSNGKPKRANIKSILKEASDDTLLCAIRISGGLGDVIVITRLLRDIEKSVAGKIIFDVYFHSPSAVKFVLSTLNSFRAIHLDYNYHDMECLYDISMTINQYITINRESLNIKKITHNYPDVLDMFLSLETMRKKIDKFIIHTPSLDGAFADIMCNQGHRRVEYIHHLLGLPYGGDCIDMRPSQAKSIMYGLNNIEYITIHDGWDNAFKLATSRPTKAISIDFLSEIVTLFKAKYKNIKMVQLGGKLGLDIPGVDINLRSKITFEESAGIIKNSLLHIDSESGLVHLATSMQVKCVVLFGPTNISWFSYKENINIAPGYCGNCWWSTETWMDACPIGLDVPICTKSYNTAKVMSAIYEEIENGLCKRKLAGSITTEVSK